MTAQVRAQITTEVTAPASVASTTGSTQPGRNRVDSDPFESPKKDCPHFDGGKP
jgi:hypothetical protein